MIGVSTWQRNSHQFLIGENDKVILGEGRRIKSGTPTTSLCFNVVLTFSLLKTVAKRILASKTANFCPVITHDERLDSLYLY